MLNLAQMFSARPAPVKGARLVKGYAMSGSKDSQVIALPSDPVRCNRTSGIYKMTQTRLSRRDEKYLPVLTEWMPTYAVAYAVGTSPASAVIVLKRMVLEGLVEMRRMTGPKGGAAVRYEWKAK